MDCNRKVAQILCDWTQFGNRPVVPVAQKNQVVEVGRSTMDPVHDVVRRAPFCRPIAAWPPAVTIAGVERAACRPGDCPLGAPDIDDRRVRAEQDAGDAAVASQPFDGLGRDRQRELHLRRRRTGEPEKRLERSGDLKIRPVERVHGQIDQGVGKPAWVVAMVVFAIALGQRLQCRAQRTGADLIQDPLDQDAAVVRGAEGEASRLHSLLLIID